MIDLLRKHRQEEQEVYSRHLSKDGGEWHLTSSGRQAMVELHKVQERETLKARMPELWKMAEARNKMWKSIKERKECK